VFVTIALTVAVQGLSSGLVARALGVMRPVDNGFVILGANALALGLARLLRLGGGDVLFMDANPRDIGRARAEGFGGILGNALEPASIEQADIETRPACIGATQNEQMNLLFVKRAREDHRAARGYVAAWAAESGITLEMVSDAGAKLLFGGAHDLPTWADRMSHGEAAIERWVWEPGEGTSVKASEMLGALEPGEEEDVLPMARCTSRWLRPKTSRSGPG
jgi:hypothetical protein